MKHMNRILLVAGAASLLMASGCKKETPPLPAPAKPAAPKAAAVQKKVSSATVAAAENPYDFTSKKDPFKPFVVAKVAPVQAPLAVPKAALLPIQSYEVSQFRVIGIIAGLSDNKAMVLDPAGKSYVLKEGMLVGPNGGKIVRITDSYVEVSEKYREDSGNVKHRSVRLALPRKQ
ncbi:MAG TPA: pilus assembly protein PilP [Verrucomicrobiae bacterium]|nr:pilus assembly protein PilP [Verrucomicrobiae bacterium]